LHVEWSRTSIRNWIQKADLQLSDSASPNRIAVDETVIQIDSDPVVMLPIPALRSVPDVVRRDLSWPIRNK